MVPGVWVCAGMLLSWVEGERAAWHGTCRGRELSLGKTMHEGQWGGCLAGQETKLGLARSYSRPDAVESRGWAASSADVLLLCHVTCLGGQPQRDRVAEESGVGDYLAELTCESLKQML